MNEMTDSLKLEKRVKRLEVLMKEVQEALRDVRQQLAGGPPPAPIAGGPPPP